MGDLKKLETPPSQQVVDLLERLLAEAKAGRVRAMAYGIVTDDDSLMADYRASHHGDISRLPTALRLCTTLMDEEMLCFTHRGMKGVVFDGE